MVDVEVSQGLEVMGASQSGDPNLSVLNGKHRFHQGDPVCGAAAIDRAQVVGARRRQRQYGANTLLLPERFAFGGEQFGRAYDAAEFTGDSGVATKIELRFTDTTATILRNYTLFAFYEFGWVYLRKSTTGTGQSESTSAADAGFGARVSLARYVTASAYVATPLTKEVAQEGNKDPRFFVGIQVAY